MKKQIFTFCIVIACTLIFSNNTFAQRSAGGSAGGSTPDLIIDLGTAGVVTVPATSPLYASIISALASLNATITNGIVTFPTKTCYKRSLLALFSTGCINNRTYNSCKSRYSSDKKGCSDDDNDNGDDRDDDNGSNNDHNGGCGSHDD